MMMIWAKVFLVVACVATTTQAKKCRAAKPGRSLPCLAPTQEGDSREVSGKECEQFDSCCIRGSKCVFEMEPKSLHPKKAKEFDVSKKLENLLYMAKKVVKKNETENGARFLGLGTSPFPCLPQPAAFPNSCKISATTPYVFDAPVNVPYCVRIPCDQYNRDLDASFDECIKRPGCYYDVELSNYRKDIGQQIMPGAPVCHLAIRNPVFHQKANDYVQQYGFWNPYYTHCLLETYADEIAKPQEGCSLISILEYFGQKPKMAGWNNITPRSCSYIGGCWLASRGCFYPVDISRVAVKSGQRSSVQRMSLMEYGRPKCQNFDDSTPRSALKSYHECLLAGCTVDPKVSTLYYNYMYEIGNEMNATDHWLFWNSVQEGKTRADNINDFEPDLYAQRSMFSPGSPLNNGMNKMPFMTNPLMSLLGSSMTNPVAPFNPNPMANPLASFNPNLMAMATLGQKPNPLLANLLSGLGQPSFCGPAFMLQGGRPCKPPAFNIPSPISYCPYAVPSNLERLMGPLKGSVEGCCDVNLCYLPKTEISHMHSGASFYYTHWSFWTQCSLSCGAGKKLRYRKCIGPDPSQCTKPLTQEEPCETAPCPAWSTWGQWAPCSKSCASGIQTSRRSCVPSGSLCVGEKERVQSCNNTPCLKLYTNWTPWMGNCDPCGTAILRTRECVTGQACSASTLKEIRQCNTKCGTWTAWGEWSKCAYDWNGGLFACKRSRKRSCLHKGKKAVCRNGSSVLEEKCKCTLRGR